MNRDARGDGNEFKNQIYILLGNAYNQQTNLTCSYVCPANGTKTTQVLKKLIRRSVAERLTHKADPNLQKVRFA